MTTHEDSLDLQGELVFHSTTLLCGVSSDTWQSVWSSDLRRSRHSLLHTLHLKWKVFFLKQVSTILLQFLCNISLTPTSCDQVRKSNCTWNHFLFSKWTGSRRWNRKNRTKLLFFSIDTRSSLADILHSTKWIFELKWKQIISAQIE